MNVIFRVDGKQCLVKIGEYVFVNKVAQEVGSEIVFTDVLRAGNLYGKPYIENCKVRCKIVSHHLGEKLRIVRFIKRKHHLKRVGYRGRYTKLLVDELVR